MTYRPGVWPAAAPDCKQGERSMTSELGWLYPLPPALPTPAWIGPGKSIAIFSITKGEIGTR